MLEMVARNWWAYVARGLFALIFGVFAYLKPGMTMKLLLLMFGIFVFIEGFFAIIGSIAARRYSGVWWLVLLEGIAGLVIGMIAMLRPEVIGLLIYLFIAVWAVWSGVFRIIVAFRLRKELENEWLLVFGGVISMLFGAMLLAHPEAGVTAIAWFIGFFAVIFGLLLITFGIKARTLLSRK